MTSADLRDRSRGLRATLAVVAVALLLTACGSPPRDPGAERSDAAAKQLRDRMEYTQGRY